MVTKKDLIIAVLATFCLTVTLFAVIPTRSSPGSIAPYDPWLDINDDGKISMDEIVSALDAFGSTGNPTKNVNVTNWPISTDISVWWREPIRSTTVLSPVYNATGFGHIHVLIYAAGLTPAGQPGGPENMTVMIRANLNNPGLPGPGNFSVTVYSIVLIGNPGNHIAEAAITIDVPSETFYFSATGAGPHLDIGDICLSFYLTWA